MTVNMKFFVRLARIIGAKSKTSFDSNIDLKGVVATGKKNNFISFKQNKKQFSFIRYLLEKKHVCFEHIRRHRAYK